MSLLEAMIESLECFPKESAPVFLKMTDAYTAILILSQIETRNLKI